MHIALPFFLFVFILFIYFHFFVKFLLLVNCIIVAYIKRQNFYKSQLLESVDNFIYMNIHTQLSYIFSIMTYSFRFVIYINKWNVTA